MKFRPQYRLRTLLAAATASAVLFACYFQFWPSWRLYREQMRFEQSVKQLKAGTSLRAGGKLVQWQTCNQKDLIRRRDADNRVLPGTANDWIATEIYSWENACYCVCYFLGPHQAIGDFMNFPSDHIQVYRLPPVPSNYPSTFWGNPLQTYLVNWQEATFSPLPRQSGPTGQLIYSDPPAK
jgi:hypothetical protein